MSSISDTHMHMSVGPSWGYRQLIRSPNPKCGNCPLHRVQQMLIACQPMVGWQGAAPPWYSTDLGKFSPIYLERVLIHQFLYSVL